MKFKNSYELMELIDQKRKNGIELNNFKRFMESIGNPQNQLKCIHIGGTNGKGSTTNALRSILQEANYRVGSFTSPYLETHHDRIRINDIFIEDEVIVNYANTYYDEWIAFDLSMFEIDMFIAVQYFVDSKVDLCLFEVGLGGTMDATNIIDPLVSVITNIGLDHMEFLGDSYEKIATQKAGIIKANKALITSEKRPECLAIFRKICKEKNAEMITCESLLNVEVDNYLTFDYKDYHIKQETLAKYQALNSALAIETIDYLRAQKMVNVTDEEMLIGIEKAVWKGRFEVVCKEPVVIVDGAHNEEGIRALVDSCQNYDNIKILFSALVDKPYDKMVDLLLTLSSDVTICEFDFSRAASAEQIAGPHPVKIIKDYEEAIQTLMEKDHILLICGSLYFITLARNYFLKKGVSTL